MYKNIISLLISTTISITFLVSPLKSFAQLPKPPRLVTAAATAAPKEAAATESQEPNPIYKRNEIRAARFGTDEMQALIEKAYQIDTQINSQIFGQEYVAIALRDKLVQYLESFGHRKNEPVALNLIGLPGIGKSAMLKVIESAGFQVVVLDAQTYVNTKPGYDSLSFAQDLHAKLERLDSSKPTIVVLEELDKVPEINHESVNEKTNDIVGTLNKILVDGNTGSSASRYYGTSNKSLSNVFFITTMNLSPIEITNFSAEALKQKKSFYDFTVEDFKAFHQWVLSNPSAVPKLLANLFRSNTVSRLAPISVLVKPLDYPDYEKVAAKTINAAIKRNSSARDANLRIDVSYSDDFVVYMNALTIYPPSGARNTVIRVDLLVEQLINFAKRAVGTDASTLLTPRQVHLDYNPKSNQVEVKVTPLKIIENKKLVEQKPILFTVDFSDQTGQFIQPEGLALNIAAAPSAAPAEPKLTKKQVRANRFPENSNKAKGLREFIGKTLFGQDQFAKTLEDEMNQYLVRPNDVLTPPNGIIFAGFPGIGKSEMINLAGKYLELPIIKINLQQYSSDSSDAITQFATHLSQELEQMAAKGQEKFIVLFEELDKVHEINAKGEQVNRPVLSVIKDLMNNGKAEVSIKNDFMSNTVKIDLSNAFVATTMNFSVDRFRFQADPRLTTIEDVIAAWSRLSHRLADLKDLLGSMFLPETVNRMISRIKILKPLSARDYAKVILAQVDVIEQTRFTDKKGVRVGQVDIQLSPEYRSYLYNESVVPSEGARFAANISRGLIGLDVEGVLKSIPKSSPLAGRPLIVYLDYKPGQRLVVGGVSAADNKQAQPTVVYEREAVLNFPPLNIAGKIPLERLVTSIHEYGHALASVNGGLPFEFVTVVPPTNGTGGYVKFRGMNGYASEIIARLYSTMASRAMERVMMSSDPLNDDSVLDITAGASNDILQATQLLFTALKQLGFAPGGGVMERMGIEGMSRYANFADLPHEVSEAFGLVLKDIEAALVRDFLNRHTREWYAEKIEVLARRGSMSEKEFYELNEIHFPGVGWVHTENNSPVYGLFKGKIADAKKNAPGRSFSVYRSAFMESVESRMNFKAQEAQAQKKPVRAKIQAGLSLVKGYCEGLLRPKKK